MSTELDFNMTPPPPPPPGKKPTQWKVVIPVAIVVVLCCICLVVTGVLYYMGRQGNGPLAMLATDTPTPRPTATDRPISTEEPSQDISGESIDFILYYDWGCTGEYGSVDISFYEDMTFILWDGPAYGTWYIEDNYFEFTFDESPYAYYVGTIDESGDYIEGTMMNQDGGIGCWYAEPY